MAYRRLQQHVGAFRDFLREQGGPTSDEQELLAAKLMGRWRSGAPLALAPEKDDPAIANDPRRNNNFSYGEMDPQGYAVPLGSDIRRMNPRDTAVNIQRRKVLRRGATYGPPLPEGSREDGVDRGIAVARAYLGENLVQFGRTVRQQKKARSQRTSGSTTGSATASCLRTHAARCQWLVSPACRTLREP